MAKQQTDEKIMFLDGIAASGSHERWDGTWKIRRDFTAESLVSIEFPWQISAQGGGVGGGGGVLSVQFLLQNK